MLNRVGDKPTGEQEVNQMEKVLLDFRNCKLADRILADPHDKIYITYGSNYRSNAVLSKARA